MLYVASVKEKESKRLSIIKSEYETKKEFREDLKNNGYSIRFIATEETFNKECEKYHEKLDRQNMINKLNNKSNNETAKILGMTVAEYKAWLNK